MVQKVFSMLEEYLLGHKMLWNQKIHNMIEDKSM